MKWIFRLIVLMMTSPVIGQEYYFRQMPLDFDGDIQKIRLLFQGKDQMIWIGTDQGLYAFDGRTSWPMKRSDGALHEVTAIAESPGGEIWAGYDDGFIHVVSVLGHNRNIPADSLKGTSISKILFQEDKDILIGTNGLGFWRIRENKLSRIRFNARFQIEDVSDALLDAQGRLWIATDRGIWIYQQSPGEEFRHLSKDQGLPDEIVTKLLAESNGDIWIGMYDHGLGRYIAGRDSIIPVIPLEGGQGSILNLVKGLSNDIWIATEKAIRNYSVDDTDRKVLIPSEITKGIENILFDYTGNLWIASGNKLFMANTQLDYRLPDVTEIQAITSLDGRLWLGCQSGLYSMEQDGSHMVQHLQQEQLNILSIYVDPSGFMWIGTFGQGLYVYDPLTGQVRHLTEKDNLANNSILNIDGKGNKIWLATLGGITEISWLSNPFKDQLKIVGFQEKFKFPAEYVYDVYVSENDRVWFGTFGKGLYYLEKDKLYSWNNLIVFPGQDTVDLRRIYSITSDHKNNLWISTTKGIVLNLDLKGNLLDHTSSAHGSLNSLITSGKGEIVIAGDGTIQVKNPSYGVFLFSSSTGLSSFLPNINAVSRDKDGSIWIADTDNILHYVPLYSDTARYVHMQVVSISPGTFQQNEIIRLRPDSSYLDLRFTGLWYPDPSRVQYRYKLEGHDPDWIYTQEGRAVYSKLSPGDYTFMVAGSYNEDFSHAQLLQQKIIVLPPFYRTLWFISGSILLVSIFAYLFIRSRIRHINKLHQLEKEKTTLQLHAIQAQVNPHFLFNSFNTLSSIIEEDQKSAVTYVDQLSGFFRGVLMHRNAELIQLSEEIIIMRNYAYILQKRYGNNIRIVEHMSTQEGFIAPLSIQLLVENAIKHNKVTNEKPLTITITIDDHLVVVSNPIQYKIQSVTESTGFGLSSLLTRYQYLTPSKIEIVNDGNIFTVRIPIIHQKDRP